ncbi:MFS transporter [Arthrobacter sp. 18067]|uniref:MFS transporter n=1 Tax=Arthrobacter sp. 18067 TaxID=2681413 RepID=UPI001F2E0DD3|nr:MFS transporter [Arthrobacter sp. 18067]
MTSTSTSSNPAVSPDQPVTPAPGAAGRVALAVSTLGFFVITLDALIVNVALATIGAQLGGGTAGQQWIVDGYTLMFASLLLFAGNLSDRIGAKRAFTFGLVLFVLASAACALAPVLWVLILARFVQGAAASLMLPPSMALIREAFPDAIQRSKAIGLWALGGAVAAAAGPALGGLLTTVDWRLVFLINVPVGAVAVALLLKVPASPERPATFDWLGQIAALIGVGALIFGLIEGGVLGFGAPQVLLALAGAVLAIAVFLRAQAHGQNPMMPLDLFQSGGLRIALSVGFSFMVGWYGMVFVISLFLQQHLGLSPLLAGLAFLPASVLIAVSNVVAGRMAAKFGPRVPAVVGQLLMVVGLLGMLLAAPAGSLVAVALLLIPIGVGGALAMPPITAHVLDSVPAHRSGTASAVFNTFRQLGGAVGVAVFGALLAGPAGFVPGLQASLLIAALLLLATAVASLFIRRIHN